MRAHLSTAAAIALIVGTWLACSPLTSSQRQAERAPAPGLDSNITIDFDTPMEGSGNVDAPIDAAVDAPVDTPTEGSGSADASVDSPVDTPTEGGVPDAFIPPDAFVPDAPPDAPPDAFIPPDDAFGAIDAPGSGSAKQDAGNGGVTGATLDETSVYRCQSGSGPAGAWPIVLALVICRRRRGSSSAR